MTQLAAQIHDCAPGHMVLIRNGRDIPDWMALACSQGDWCEAMFHTLPPSVLYSGNTPVIRHGLAASRSGTGQEALIEHHGVPVAGTYFSKRPDTSFSYPAHFMAPPARYSKGERRTYPSDTPGHEGGSQTGAFLVAKDGTLPLKAMVRVLVIPSRQLWSKKDGSNEQHLHLPDNVFITHIILVALPTRCQQVDQLTHEMIKIPISLSTHDTIRFEREVYGEARIEDNDYHEALTRYADMSRCSITGLGRITYACLYCSTRQEEARS